jgi:hypothetical protein
MTPELLFSGAMTVLVGCGIYAGILRLISHSSSKKRHKALDAAILYMSKALDPDTLKIDSLRMSAHALNFRDKAAVRLHTLDAQASLVDAGWNTKLVFMSEPLVFIIVAAKGSRVEMLVYRSE